MQIAYFIPRMRDSDPALLQTWSATVVCDAAIPKAVRRRIAEDPESFVRRAAALPLKISRETLVLQTELQVGERMLSAVVKQYRPRELWKAAAAMFRPSKAAWNWAKAEFLRRLDIATPRPLLACRERGWRNFGGCFLVSEFVTGENLHIFGWRVAQRPQRERLRTAAQCAEQLGRLVGRMHAADTVHRDLKAANFLAVEEPVGLAAEEPARLQVWLVDLDGLKIGQRIDLSRQARDLGRLAAGLAAHPWVTRTICLRFLRAYAGEFPAQIIAWKPLWKAIAARASQIIARKRRRGEEPL